ncbi:MAG: hypothetical protein K2P94_03925 [Rhodospirillaceae bacterium]|nr:hypothetical protein [Rhodospirillaceae bacterium]
MTTNARQEVHDFVRDLYREPALKRAFIENPEEVIAARNFTASEKNLLIDGSFPALHELRMHPLVQMVYAVARNPAMTAQISFRDYLSDLE